MSRLPPNQVRWAETYADNYEWYPGGGSGHWTWKATCKVYSEQHGYRGGVTKDFHAKKARGEFIAPTVYMRTDMEKADCIQKTQLTFVPADGFGAGFSRRAYTLTNQEGFGDSARQHAFAQLEPVDMRDLMNQASGRMNKNADIGPFLAQIKQTRELVLQALRRLFTFVAAAAAKILTCKSASGTVREIIELACSLNVRDVRKYPTELANLYLEIIYGWRPLVSDIETIHKQLVRLFKDQTALPERVRGQAERTQIATVSGTVEQPKPIAGERMCGQEQMVKLEYSGQISLSRNAIAWGSPRYPKRTFVLNPLSTAYDVVAFSFVLDWVYNLSSYLKAAQVGLYVSPLGGSTGLRLTADLKGTYSGYIAGVYQPSLGTCRMESFTASGQYRLREYTVIRDPEFPGASLPELVRLPAILTHLWESIALLLSKGTSPYGKRG